MKKKKEVQTLKRKEKEEKGGGGEHTIHPLPPIIHAIPTNPAGSRVQKLSTLFPGGISTPQLAQPLASSKVAPLSAAAFRRAEKYDGR
jgi:hypothetical protein